MTRPRAARPNPGRWVPHLFRGVAVLIVLLALLDPTLVSERRVDARVGVVGAGLEPGTARTGAPGREAASLLPGLAARFDLVRGADPGAQALVVLGEEIPPEVGVFPGPVFLVHPEGDPPPLLVALDLPSRASPWTRVPVQVTVGPGWGEGPLSVVLRSGDLVLDRGHAEEWSQDEGATTALPEGRHDPRPGHRVAHLSFVPPHDGVLPLALEVEGPRGERHLLARTLLRVEEARHTVLFLEPRPAWRASFARRALGDDPRFSVSARVETAPGSVTTLGDPPRDPWAPGALDPWEVVVVGAPDALDSGALGALERWVRTRGGTLVLLPDAPEGGGFGPEPWHGLVGASGWRGSVTAEEQPFHRVRGGDRALPGAAPVQPPLQGRSWGWPDPLPGGAAPLLVDEAGHPVVWERSIGRGTILVSGAFDAWQFRDPARSAYEATWRALAEWAAVLAAPALELAMGPASWGGVSDGRSRGPLPGPGGGGGAGAGVVAPPGTPLRLAASLPLVGASGSAGGGLQGSVDPSGSEGGVRGVAALRDATREGEPRLLPLPLVPAPEPGTFEARFRAPERPGLYRVEVALAPEAAPPPTGGGTLPGSAATGTPVEGHLWLMVEADAPPPGVAPHPTWLDIWARSRGGEGVRGVSGSELAAILARGVDAPRRQEAWHPMRSPWWILPFALALAGEWWWRRRRGLP